jgi:hypothetical protein
MNTNVIVLLAVIALILTILSAMGKAPLWIAVLLLAIIELLQNF